LTVSGFLRPSKREETGAVGDGADGGSGDNTGKGARRGGRRGGETMKEKESAHIF